MCADIPDQSIKWWLCAELILSTPWYHALNKILSDHWFSDPLVSTSRFWEESSFAKLYDGKCHLKQVGLVSAPFYGCRTNSFYSFYNCTEIKSGISFLPDLKSPEQTWGQIMCPILNNPYHSLCTCRMWSHSIWNQLWFEQNEKYLRPNGIIVMWLLFS